jgi:hypothetical protein
LRRSLQAALETKGVKGLGPKLDVKTRWSSTFYLIERFLLIEPGLSTIQTSLTIDIGSQKSLIPYPSSSEIALLIGIVSILKPTEKYMRWGEGELYMTLPHVAFWVQNLIIHFSPIAGEARILFDFRSLCLKQLHFRFDYILKSVSLALKAAALHPLYGSLFYD